MPRDSAYEIRPDELLKAYSLGYFPMARTRDDPGVLWVLPEKRGVLDLEKAHVPRKLQRFMKREPYRVTIDAAFSQVIAACASPAPGREDTWINAAIETVYTELRYLGYAHSVECWDGETLVGGLYGVALGGVFCGESMFSRADHASKIALVNLIARLKAGGFVLLDTQFHTEHLAQFGVEEIDNEVYLRRLGGALEIAADFYRLPVQSSTISVLQSITQTS